MSGTNSLESYCRKGYNNFLYPISRCSVSPNGNLILFGSLAEAFSINGALVPLFESETSDHVNTCIFSPNGQLVLAWSYYIDGLFHLLSEIGINFPVQDIVQI